MVYIFEAGIFLFLVTFKHHVTIVRVYPFDNLSYSPLKHFFFRIPADVCCVRIHVADLVILNDSDSDAGAFREGTEAPFSLSQLLLHADPFGYIRSDRLYNPAAVIVQGNKCVLKMSAVPFVLENLDFTRFEGF